MADAKQFDMSADFKKKRTLSYREAVLEAQCQAMTADANVFVMGEGVDDTNGSFGTTIGLQERFGSNRVLDLPLAENTCMGMAIGAALTGMRPVLVHLRVDFTLLAMDQIVNHAAKWHYMFDGRQCVPVVVRCIIGRGWGSAAQHSQSLQGLFQHVPGLKVVMPATAYDAKGLLLASIADNSPVIFLEHRWLYDSKEHVPENIYTVPIGQSAVPREGTDITIAAVSLMVHEALAAAKELASDGIEAEVLDMRCVKPMDRDALARSLNKTGRLIVADTGNILGGWTAEVAAFVAEELLHDLKAPLVRIGLPDIPTPASAVLETQFYPGKNDIVHTVKRILNA